MVFVLCTFYAGFGDTLLLCPVHLLLRFTINIRDIGNSDSAVYLAQLLHFVLDLSPLQRLELLQVLGPPLLLPPLPLLDLLPLLLARALLAPHAVLDGPRVLLDELLVGLLEPEVVLGLEVLLPLDGRLVLAEAAVRVVDLALGVAVLAEVPLVEDEVFQEGVVLVQVALGPKVPQSPQILLCLPVFYFVLLTRQPRPGWVGSNSIDSVLFSGHF